MDFIKKILSRKQIDSAASPAQEPQNESAKSDKLLSSPDKVVDVYNALRREGKPIPGIVAEKMGNLCRDLQQQDVSISHYEVSGEGYVRVQAWSEAIRVARKVEETFGVVTKPLWGVLLEAGLGRGMSDEAIEAIRGLEKVASPSDSEVIDRTVKTVQSYPELSARIDIALYEFLIGVGRSKLAGEVLNFARSKSLRSGNLELAREIESLIAQLNVSSEEDDALSRLVYGTNTLNRGNQNKDGKEEESVPEVPLLTELGIFSMEKNAIHVIGEDSRNGIRSDEEVVKELIRQLKEGISNEESEDVPSQYELGVAFLEMDLLEEAIESLQFAFNHPEYRLRAVQGLAQAWNKSGAAFLSAKLLDEVLETTDLEEGTRIGLLYWRARTFELQDSPQKAKEIYTEIALKNSSFMDVLQRIKKLV